MKLSFLNIFKNGLAIVLFASCVEPFSPPYSDADVNFLVVDGYINTSDNSATVKLSRAASLASSDAIIAERNAIVSIEDEDGNFFSLSEQSEGTYGLSSISLNLLKKYKLNVQTGDSKTYQSEFIQLTQAPAIDSIQWKPASDGVTIYANTHNEPSATRYYRWDYVETYMYNSAFDSNFKRIDDAVIYRTIDERIHTCWRTVTSSKILIGSSAKLTQNAITNYPLTFLPKGTEKLDIGYSMEVKQRAISQDEYNFLDQLRKTTESLGGLFDPLPSQVVGNVTSVSNPSEPVLGNFSGGSVATERIFIKASDLPPDLRVYNNNTGGCIAATVLLADLPNLESQYLLVDPVLMGGITLIGYTFTTIPCADCRTAGGTNIQPPFWE
jgi:Domain of unknown function (DUF4249)